MHIKNDKSVDDFLNEVKLWMNKNVAPHNLEKISIFEDDHPNEKKGLNAVILYSGVPPVDTPTADLGAYEFKKE